MSGIVYLLTNKAMPGLVKVGKTKAYDMWKRMTELKTTGVPGDFECVKAKRVEDPAAVESALHKAFDPDRYDPKREFFEINPEQASAVLDAIDGKDVTHEAVPPVNRTGNRSRWIRRAKKRAILVEGRGSCDAFARGDFAVIDPDGGEDSLRPHELVHLPSGALIIVASGDPVTSPSGERLRELAEALQAAFSAWHYVTSPCALRDLLRADGPERTAYVREALRDFAAGGAVWREILRAQTGPKFKLLTTPNEQETF